MAADPMVEPVTVEALTEEVMVEVHMVVEVMGEVVIP